MKILFLSVGIFNSYYKSGIYPDLLRSFINDGHEVFSIIPSSVTDTRIIKEGNNTVLQIKTGQVTGNSNLLLKGIRLLSLANKYKKAIKKYCKKEHFDLILYATPPITLYNAIKYAKKKFKAKSALLLKDIFPQNAVDIGLLSYKGIKGIITRYFRHIEKKYYAISDIIGCMSNANVKFLLENNPEVDSRKVFISPNSVDISRICEPLSVEQKRDLRVKYNIPKEKRVFIYGGNLGKPQDVSFIVECIKACKSIKNAFFIVCGSGGEYSIIKEFYDNENPKNLLLINGLPQEEYNRLVAVCDIGLIFLDHRFTIPNYPSRLLSYMQCGIPVLACTDNATDIGDDIVTGKFGWKCSSSDVESFIVCIDEIVFCDDVIIKQMGKRAFEHMKDNFSVDDSMKKIVEFINKK